MPWLAVLAGASLVAATVAGALEGGEGETAYLTLVALAARGFATGMAARRVPVRPAVASVGIGVGVIAIGMGAVAFATSGVEGLAAILIGLPAIAWSCAGGGWWVAGRIGALRGRPAGER